jgi:hypothetical protein
MIYEKINTQNIDGTIISSSVTSSNSNLDNRVSVWNFCTGSNVPVSCTQNEKGKSRKKLELDVYRTMKSLSASEGIPLSHLKAAKTLNLTGFRTDGRVNWNELEPAYRANLDKIEDFLDNSIERLKKEKLKRDIERADLTIAELKKQKIDIKDINEFMIQLALQLNGLLFSKIVKELPPRVIGKSEEESRFVCKEMVNDIVEVLKTNISEWNPTPL